MSTRGRRRSPRKRPRSSSEEEQEDDNSSSSSSSPPPKKQKRDTTKTNNKKKKNTKKKKVKEDEDGYIYLVQGRLEGIDSDDEELNSDDGDPAGFDTETYNAFKTRTKANAEAISVYKQNTKKKHQKISTRHDYKDGLFNKTSPIWKKKKMPDGWSGVQYHSWVLKMKIL